MHLAELSDTLPNGLHDAELHRLEMDFTSGRLLVTLDVWVGDMQDPSRREAYRRAHLTISAVSSLVIEPPGAPNLRLTPGSIRIDVGYDHLPHDVANLPTPPPGHCRAYFFLDDLNTFLHVVGGTADLAWQGEEWVSRSTVP